MVTAKCRRCGGEAEGSSLSEASQNINHAVGLSRGIKCGDNYGKVVEIEGSKPSTPKAKKTKTKTTKSEPVKE